MVMTAHKHAAMIKAKADNMDLVVFIKMGNSEWRETSEIPTCEGFKYFLCLPQHKEACLHWLNGGDVQQRDVVSMEWNKGCIESYLDNPKWNSDEDFMDECCELRIKPCKEKRWIGFSPKSNIVTGMSFSTKESLAEHVNQNFAYPEYVQAIEIEVEV